MKDRIVGSKDIEDLDPQLLFQAMVGFIGIKQTGLLLEYYYDLKEAIEKGELDDRVHQI